MREKSEMEKMREETQKQFVQQRLDDLGKYLDKLFKELEAAGTYYLRNQAISSAAMLVWMISVISLAFSPASSWARINEDIANLIFWITIARVWLLCIPMHTTAIAEIRGCLKTLELLGIIDPLDSGRRRKLKMAEESKIAKVWDWLKQKARSEAYSPA